MNSRLREIGQRFTELEFWTRLKVNAIMNVHGAGVPGVGGGDMYSSKF